MLVSYLYDDKKFSQPIGAVHRSHTNLYFALTTLTFCSLFMTALSWTAVKPRRNYYLLPSSSTKQNYVKVCNMMPSSSKIASSSAIWLSTDGSTSGDSLNHHDTSSTLNDEDTSGMTDQIASSLYSSSSDLDASENLFIRPHNKSCNSNTTYITRAGMNIFEKRDDEFNVLEGDMKNAGEGLPRNSYDRRYLEEKYPLQSTSSQQKQQQQQQKMSFEKVANQSQKSLPRQQEQIESIVRKKIRVARAQAEIDRILTGPDAPPCDLDQEWMKVLSVTPSTSSSSPTTVPLNPTNDITTNHENGEHATRSTTGDLKLSRSNSTLTIYNDSFDADSIDNNAIIETEGSVKDEYGEHQRQQLDLQQRQHEVVCEELEKELYQAVKQNDFDTALTKRESIDRLQMESANAVLQANAAFYKAFSSRNYQAMSELWIPDSTATCIHPTYNKPLVGNRAVLQNWYKIFHDSKSRNMAYQRSWVEPSHIHIATIGSCSVGIVTCHENVYVRRFVRGEKRRTVQVRTLHATNIFRKMNGKWYLQYHHASPISESLPSFTGGKNGINGSQNQRDINGSKRRSLLYNANKFDQYYDDSEEDNDDDIGTKDDTHIGMDGILGLENYGADLGASTSSMKKSNSSPKRIIMSGSLSDLLNGNLQDLLSSASSSSPSSSDNEKLGNGKSNSGYAIIRVSRTDGEDVDDDDDEDDDDEDDEDDDESDDDDDDDDENEEDLEKLQKELQVALDQEKKNNAASVSIIKQWADVQSEKMERQADIKDLASPTTQQLLQSQRPIPVLKDDSVMLQECIATLRKLTQRGMLTPTQKRVLLTDIISCSSITVEAKQATAESIQTIKKKSIVQVAYELLLGSRKSDVETMTTSVAPEIKTESSNIDNPVEDWMTVAEEEFAEQCRIYADTLI